MGLPPQGIKAGLSKYETLIQWESLAEVTVPDTHDGLNALPLAIWEITNDSYGTDPIPWAGVRDAFYQGDVKCVTGSLDQFLIILGYSATNPFVTPADANQFTGSDMRTANPGSATYIHDAGRTEHWNSVTGNPVNNFKYFGLFAFLGTGGLTAGRYKNLTFQCKVVMPPGVSYKQIFS